MEKFAGWFAEWFTGVMEHSFTVQEILIGLLIALGIALIVCVVRDEPIVTWVDGEKQYKLTFRGVTEVE